MVILWVFLFSFLPASGCGCHGSAMTYGDSGYGGLWLLQMVVMAIGAVVGVVEEVVVIVFCVIVYYYFNEIFILFK